MHLTVLAATGATGRELTRQALERGHTVTAIARDRDRIPDAEHLLRVSADVRDVPSIKRAVASDAVVLSALGVAKGDRSGTLTAGASALVAAAPRRILWLGAFGTGVSAEAAGAFTRLVLRLALGAEIPDKVAADAAVLSAGGTVFHAGPLSNGPLSSTRRIVPLEAAPRRFLPTVVSRATVAAAMLDEAEADRYPGRTVLPLPR